MFTEVRARFAKATQINDLFDSGIMGGGCELRGEVAVLIGVVGTGRFHGMD